MINKTSRLLFITERFPPDIGGVASSADRLCKNLSQLGLEVDILVWSRYLQPGELLQPDVTLTNSKNPQVYRIGRYRHWDMTMPHTLNILDWLQQNRNYNMIWGHYIFPGGFLATCFAAMNNLISIVSVRGNDIDKEMFPPGDFARLQWTLTTANVITTVTQDLAKKVKILSNRNDIKVIKNAVNTDIFCLAKTDIKLNNLKPELGIAENEIILGFSGELREKKGQRFLLDALNKVREKYPACLLIIGEVRNTQETVLQLYKNQYPENSERIIITGHLQDRLTIANYLQLCDIYLQPSLWEGMPNALLEAMACGCCCIVSDAGGIPEIMENGKEGFILPRHQLNYLGDAILECWELGLEMRKKIGLAASDRIQKEFSLASEKQRLQTILSSIIQN